MYRCAVHQPESSEPAVVVLFRRMLWLPWTWPIPALLVQGLILLFSRRIWTDMITVRDRSGGASQTTAANQYLIVIAGASITYWVVYFMGDLLFMTRRYRVRPPTEAEKGCITAALRVCLLAVLYFSMWTMLRDYVV